MNDELIRAYYGALFEAQITGLAFIRVNANGHVQVLPSDRVQLSVIQAVEERTTAAQCDHVYGDVGFKVKCIKCGAD